MTPIETQHEKELACRESDGIAVSLRWNPETGDISVTVEDSQLGKTLVLRAEPQQALQVYHHPYAYAPRTNE
jgi:hypothetical protein